MRKSLCKMFCCLIALCCVVSMCVPSASANTLGDVNGDNAINASDALLDLQHSVALTSLTAEQAKAGDVNQDYVVNASDALLILQYSVGLIHNFQFGAITSSARSLSLRPGGCAVVDIKSSDEGLVCYYDGNYIEVYWEEDPLPDGSWPLAIAALNVSEDISTTVTICYEDDESTYIDIDVTITSSASALYYNSSVVPDFGALTRTAPDSVQTSISEEYGYRSFFCAYRLCDLDQNYGVSPLDPYISLVKQYGFNYDPTPPQYDDGTVISYIKYHDGGDTRIILRVRTDVNDPYISIYYAFA